MISIASASFLLLLATSNGRQVTPPKDVVKEIAPVFKAYEAVQQSENSETMAQLETALEAVFNDTSAIGDESLGVLLGFYLGEHAGEDIACEIVGRGRRMVRILQKYDGEVPSLRGIPSRAQVRDAASYPEFIKAIQSGETCIREP